MRILVILLLILISLQSCQRQDLEVNRSDPALHLKNGVLHYQGKPFNGTLFAKHDFDTYKMKIAYKDGRKDGLEQQWYLNGEIAQFRTYHKGVKVGNHLGWWPNGTPKFAYTFNDEGAYHGKREEWYKNGQLVLSFNYVDGKEQGRQRMWNDTGKIKANYDVVGNERFGLIGLKKCYTLNINSNEIK
ncbi:toxin-antitoxin system YwqK family antitoxin [uncultured Croceitalea sp.]|uniref:toxin-antitoxin system YwqK family antitoxin n=1 Tax=uncultured Croceitalea sp. TaxID=1798908 RepID=UPI00374E65F7